MATIEELKTREADCSSALEFAALARDAATLDAVYAKELLGKAELQCQMPPDYIAAAEGAAAVGDLDYAKDLYGQAEDACFEPMELAALGASLGRSGVDADKGRELLTKAAGEVSKLNELLTVAGYAKETLGDEALANALLAKVEEKAKTLDDYLDLARTLKAEGAAEAGRGFYAKAARYCEDMDATVAYARGMIEIFEDGKAARKVLDDAETDCQFPRDFAALAAGYKALFDDDAKVAELMDQAAEFAMSGEENLDLAKGYWTLLGGKDKAVEAFGKALPEVNDKGQLMELAGYIAREVKAPELAKRYYAEAEEKMASAAERIKLAEAVLRDTGDKDYAAEVYTRAADSLTQPNDLMSVAGNLVDQLGDKAKAGGIYRKAFAAMNDLGQYTKLLEVVDSKLGDKDFAREIITTAGKAASGTPEYLDVAKRAVAVLGDKALARTYMSKAEEQVTSVGEMKSVVAAVKEHYADDAEWVAVAEEKLVRREANQEKYALFQEREKAATSTIRLLALSDAVMAELEDKFYAQKLLVDAQKRLEQEGWDFAKARMLVQAVSRHLGDSEWAARLLKDAAGRVQGFANLLMVAEAAVELLPDRDGARALAGEILSGYRAQLDARSGTNAYDYSKLATATGRLLGDRDAAGAMLDQAAAQGGDHFVFAELARVAAQLGLDDKVDALLHEAATRCDTAAQARQLAERLLASGFARDRVRTLYAELGGRCSGFGDRLAWADGIIDIFADRAWADEAYQTLEQEAQGDHKTVVQGRRRQRTGAHA